MTKPLFLEERHQYILDQVREHGRVSVNVLSEQLGVSTVTIRQDLRALERAGLLERTYGGAVLTSPTTGTISEFSYDVRQTKRQTEKRLIADFAAKLVHDDSAIAVDGSTTVAEIIPLLRAHSRLTIVTHSLMVAHQLANISGIEVLMPAGRVRGESVSLVGRPDTLPEINVNIGFFGARGLALDPGITDVNPEEVVLKRALLARCKEVVILADGSKWGQVAPYTFAAVNEVNRVVTTDSAPDEAVDQFRAMGVDVTITPSE